jgi:GNAT superfamily N-acetyltransferase
MTFKQYLTEKTNINIEYNDGFLVLKLKNDSIICGKLTGSEVSGDFYPEITEIDLGDWVFNIESIDVEPEYRGKGYAQQLLTFVIDWAKKQRFDGLLLNASPSGYPKVPLKQLLHIYSKMGFKEILNQKTNVIMYKKLIKELK